MLWKLLYLWFGNYYIFDFLFAWVFANFHRKFPLPDVIALHQFLPKYTMKYVLMPGKKVTLHGNLFYRSKAVFFVMNACYRAGKKNNYKGGGPKNAIIGPPLIPEHENIRKYDIFHEFSPLFLFFLSLYLSMFWFPMKNMSFTEVLLTEHEMIQFFVKPIHQQIYKHFGNPKCSNVLLFYGNIRWLL